MDFDLDPDEREMFDEINIVSNDDEPSMRVRKPTPSRNFRKKSVSFSGGGGGDDEPMDMFANSSKMNVSQPPPPVEWDGGEDMEDPMMHQNHQRSIPTGPSEGYKTLEDEKADLLNRINRLSKKGMQTSSKFTIYSDIEDIRAEYKRIMYSIEVDQSIKFQRRMLVACVSGIEFLNKKFDPFDLELDGWSENIMENQEDYDTVFEELFQKYRSKVSVAPEIKLMFMVGGSAMMFHLSKSIFKPLKQMQTPQNAQEAVSGQNPFGMGGGGRREMRGPGIDLASLGKGLDISSILGTLQQAVPPPSQQQFAEEDEYSDIISIGSEVKDVEITNPDRKKRGRSRQKKELVL
jgi:hypothetical protein